MNVVYVLVSTPNDTYYEQAVISLVSLRKHNPDANVYFIVDQDTAKTLTGKRTLHEKYDAKIIKVDVSESYPNMVRSRFLKTTMNTYISDAFLYMDGDTIVCDRLDELEQQNVDIGMVLDLNRRFSDYPTMTRQYFLGNISNIGLPNNILEDRFFNGGVMWCSNNENAKKLFDAWHKNWKNGYEEKQLPFDQPSLNGSNILLGGLIKEISGVYNCQASRYCSFVQYLADAKIIHYFATAGDNCYDLADKNIQRSILENEHTELDRILNNPRAAFSKVLDVNANKSSIEIMLSKQFSVSKSLFENHHKFFLVCESFFHHLASFINKIKKIIQGVHNV